MGEGIRRLVDRLGLQPHPEGGFFREVYRSSLNVTHPGVPAGHEPDRSVATSIYFLLPVDDFSAFHRVRWSDELWHFYAGDAIELHLIHGNGDYEKRVLTSDLVAGEPTTAVPAGCWQAARVAPGGAWALAGCTVAPGFDFAEFEMPGRGELLREFPRHEAIVRALTRERS